MSHFVFGEIHFLDGDENASRDAIAWKVTKIGVELGLHVSLECNIVQQVVQEMLREHHEATWATMPFMISSSPIADYADALISPLEVTPDALRENLRNLRDWACKVMNLSSVRQITLFATEGYDTEFEEMQSSAMGLDQVLLFAIDSAGEVPSLAITITP